MGVCDKTRILDVFPYIFYMRDTSNDRFSCFPHQTLSKISIFAPRIFFIPKHVQESVESGSGFSSQHPSTCRFTCLPLHWVPFSRLAKKNIFVKNGWKHASYNPWKITSYFCVYVLVCLHTRRFVSPFFLYCFGEFSPTYEHMEKHVHVPLYTHICVQIPVLVYAFSKKENRPSRVNESLWILRLDFMLV